MIWVMFSIDLVQDPEKYRKFCRMALMNVAFHMVINQMIRIK